MKTAVALVSLLTLASCAKVQKAEDNMEAMRKQTSQMQETTQAMYKQVRSKEAEATRNQKLAILKSKDESFGSKLAAAAVYYMSFEFQLWTGKNSDTQENREKLYLDAVNEFVKELPGFYQDINVRTMSPVKEGKKQSEEQTFYALAAAMHMNHHYQEELASGKSKIKAVSFYDLVKAALLKDEAKEQLAPHESALVSQTVKPIMIELIKARVDMLSALALKNLTDKEKMTFGQKLKGLLCKSTGCLLGSIDLPVTFHDANESTRDEVLKYLDAAVKDQRFLRGIGIDKRLGKTLASAFQEIDLEYPEDEGETVQNEKADDEKRLRTMELIENLLK